jgi:hypothetical protein
LKLAVAGLQKELKDAQTAAAKSLISAADLQAEVKRLKTANDVQQQVRGKRWVGSILLVDWACAVCLPPSDLLCVQA